MIPLGDNLPTLRRPVVTLTVIGATAAVWLVGQSAGFNEVALATSVCNFGLVPGELTGQAALGFSVPLTEGLACNVDDEPINVLTPALSIFLHGSWAHIIGNMLFLFVFGNNVEDSMGHVRFLVFYMLCGLAAAASHVLLNPASPVPTVGASGAVSGVMGAYLLLYPRARIKMLFIFFIFFKIFRIQAWVVLIWWFLLQVVTGLPELISVRSDISGGVAVWAHVGGFLAGALLIKLFADRALVSAHRQAYAGEHGYGWRR